jgi:hypothetical protein
LSKILIPSPYKDAFIATNYPKKNFGCSSPLFVGTSLLSSNATFRSMLKFDISSIPKNSAIASATLNMFISRNDYATEPKHLDIHLLTERFSEKEVTWKKHPPFSPIVEATTQITDELKVNAKWDITEVLRGWQEGKVPNKGIMVKTRDEYRGSILAFDSRENPNVERRPNLRITLGSTQSVYVEEPKVYSNVERSLISTDELQVSLSYDISQVCFHSFCIQNKGPDQVSVVAQVSPDACDSTWLNASEVAVVNPTDNFAITTTQPAKLVRIAFASTNPGQQTQLDIWFQAET